MFSIHRSLRPLSFVILILGGPSQQVAAIRVEPKKGAATLNPGQIKTITTLWPWNAEFWPFMWEHNPGQLIFWCLISVLSIGAIIGLSVWLFIVYRNKNAQKEKGEPVASKDAPKEQAPLPPMLPVFSPPGSPANGGRTPQHGGDLFTPTNSQQAYHPLPQEPAPEQRPPIVNVNREVNITVNPKYEKTTYEMPLDEFQRRQMAMAGGKGKGGGKGVIGIDGRMIDRSFDDGRMMDRSFDDGRLGQRDRDMLLYGGGPGYDRDAMLLAAAPEILPPPPDIRGNWVNPLTANLQAGKGVTMGHQGGMMGGVVSQQVISQGVGGGIIPTDAWVATPPGSPAPGFIM